MKEEPLNPSDPRLVDGYRIVARLGEGASGIVYRAVHSDGSEVALKVLRPELANDPQVRERLRREAVALQRVAGGRTAKILKVDADGENPYLAMELVPGRSLNNFVEEQGPLRSGLLWSSALGLVEALTSIHSAGVIHRDLKPSNIMIGSDGVKVVDFGVSALHEASSLTGTGTFIGTASWVSPEQVIGSPITEASDVFSLGMVLAYASSGVHPFGTGRTDAVMFRIAHEQADLVAVPDGLRSLVESCLNKNPILRPTLNVLESLLRESSFSGDSGGAGVPSGSGTMIIGQTVIETGMKTAEPAVEPSVISSTSKFKARQKQLALASAAVILIAGVVFFAQRSKSNESIKNADVANTVAKDVAKTTVPQPSDLFKRSLGTFVAKSSAVANTRLGFGLEDSYLAPTDVRNQIWGTQLDCDEYYPLYDLGFGDGSINLKSGSLIKSTEDDANGAYVIDYRFFTGFNKDPMNFTRRAAVVESKFSGCSDTDYYPSTDVEIGPCIGNIFDDEYSAFPYLDDTCAKDALRSWKYNSSSKNTKVGFYPDSPANGRVGSQYAFATTPRVSDQCCATVQWATAIVWERENIGLVLTVAGFATEGFKVKFKKLDDSTLALLSELTAVAHELVTDAYGS